MVMGEPREALDDNKDGLKYVNVMYCTVQQVSI